MMRSLKLAVIAGEVSATFSAEIWSQLCGAPAATLIWLASAATASSAKGSNPSSTFPNSPSWASRTYWPSCPR